MNKLTLQPRPSSIDVQCLELVVSNAHALRAGSTGRHSFSHAGGTIGSRGADWLLDDGQGQVEAIHCEIAWIDHSYCVRDQSGATRVNDTTTPLRRGAAVRLRDGDKLHIGAFVVMAHLQAPEKLGASQRSLAQHSIGELLNEPPVGLQPVSGTVIPLETTTHKADFSAFDALAAKSSATDELDPLAALDAAQRNPPEAVPGADPLDHTHYGLSPSHTQVDHARTRFEAISGSPRTLSGASPMPQSLPKTGDINLLLQPLIEGLGAAVGPMDHQECQRLLLEAGKALAAAIRGIAALQAAEDSKQRYLAPLSRTLQPIEDNPLRLGLDYPDTVRALFSAGRSVVHLSPSAAIGESLAQVHRHQIAMTQAIEAGLQALLRAFAPGQLRQRFERYQPGPAAQAGEKDWNWQMYTHYYNELSSPRQQGFEKLFWEVFEQAYDQTLRLESR
ncbi:type VI secretion system-associated FHA domain protein TagH [Paraburkholderia hayleyella]|uniref:type VI secretion system-associated FHA domain protein TagH n=1 Tax=Paraburkholderia hayleyella TaxID=2152889 RepID=UPI001291EB9B|nr:type VI secretion system-associated FHA domain protein TagH [Paraburkholderia hayleyella]